MNTAARMESLGRPHQVQLSEASANLLRGMGKGSWLIPREEVVVAKGKGEVKTFWLKLTSTGSSEASSATDFSAPIDEFGFDADRGPFDTTYEIASRTWMGTPLEEHFGKTKIEPTTDRLIAWNVELLQDRLEHILAERLARDGTNDGGISSDDEMKLAGDLVLDEIKMSIPFPDFDGMVAIRTAGILQKNKQLGQSLMSDEAKSELHKYVAAIATAYLKNSFHSFDHASHVTMSAHKLTKRILSVDDDELDGRRFGDVITSKDVHNHTFGIGSSPITLFTIGFAALIHDVGHTGVPNGQLAKDNPALADKYQKCLAEQQSVDIAWGLLMLPAFTNLRRCIFCTLEEGQHFRQLLVNNVMATDIFDKELKALRTSRWEQSFDGCGSSIFSGDSGQMDRRDRNRRATIVMEHVIQASDVCHTMQHWYIYQKWNGLLYQEMYAAYVAGKSEKDPTDGWYKGELWFFDNYVIPLGHRLKDCGVFGAQGDEYLNYALQNRSEWEAKGEEIVKRFHKEALEKYGPAKPKTPRQMELLQASALHASKRKLKSRTVRAPAGTLGIVLEPTTNGPMIDHIQQDSPLVNHVDVGDHIVAVNGQRTKGLSIEEVSTLLQESSQRTRTFVVE